MAAKNDFWLLVHDLANCVREDGTQREDALRNIVYAFHALPAVTREGLVADLRFLIDKLPELHQSIGCPSGAAHA